MPLLTINLRFLGLTYDSALLALIHFCYDCVTCPCVAVGLDCLYCRFLLGCSHLSVCLLVGYACLVVSESDGSFFSELLGSYSLAMPLSYFDFEVAVEPDDAPHRSRLVSREQRRPRPTKAIRARKRDWVRVRPDSADRIRENVSTLNLDEYIYAALDAGAEQFVRWVPAVSVPDSVRCAVVHTAVLADSSHGDQEFIWNNWRTSNKFERMESARRYLRGRPLRGSALWRKLTSYYRRQLQAWLSTYDRYQADVVARGGRQDPPLEWDNNPVFSDGKLVGHLLPGEYGFYVPASLAVPAPRS